MPLLSPTLPDLTAVALEDGARKIAVETEDLEETVNPDNDAVCIEDGVVVLAERVAVLDEEVSRRASSATTWSWNSDSSSSGLLTGGKEESVREPVAVQCAGDGHS